MTRARSPQLITSVFLLCVSGLLASSLGGVRTEAGQVLNVASSKAEETQGTTITTEVEEDATSNGIPRNVSDAVNGSSEISNNTGVPIQPDQLSEAGIPDANPNRPSSSNSAEVLDPGVMQLEYGFNKNWEPAGNRQMTVGGEVRFGVWRNIELRWGSDPLVGNFTPNGHALGIGDQYFSGQFQFQKQSDKFPALAVSYAVTVPTGNESLGFGTGRVSHSWTFLASKDFYNITCDFNATYDLIGRQVETGYDQNAVFYLAFQRTIYGPLSVIAEFGEATRLNDQTPTNSTTLGALAYKLNRRVVIDSAIDAGVTRGAPQKRIAFGITYVIGKLY